MTYIDFQLATCTHKYKHSSNAFVFHRPFFILLHPCAHHCPGSHPTFDGRLQYRHPNIPSRPGGSLNSLTVNGTQVTAKFNISVSVNNPTWFSRVYYNAVSVEVFYRGEALVLKKSCRPSFTTHRKSVINMTPSVHKSLDFGGPLSSKDGMVEFGLVVSSFIKYKNIFPSPWRSLKVVCNPLRFTVSSNDFNTSTSGILLEGLTCTSTW
ncbi:hypothetical protein MtrunA17_Chr4g0062961 [Medicago truncatula]|uniref:Late embryogenesis abundant protein LEA-2 subgroup domain-containing protein n=1 Tax=Medicago truncatula TaxID=3880 RepID=G7JU71_MEDTR|nr:hypothetical protein MTR_4g113220 [Medicago truncatula]RHN63869.1 hypothetical protein MtrunA17_Chr4g0062961 [Medicago truncatula]